MKKAIITAAILVLVQIGLIAATNIQKSGYAPYAPDEQLLAFEPETIEALHIDGKETDGLSLRRKGDGWVIAKSVDIPVADGQVENLLAKLAGFKRGLAVATSEEAAERFEVAADNYAFRVSLEGGGETRAVVYFGTSPGFEQLHARTENTTEIVTVGLGSHELTPEVRQWIDTELLKLEKKQIESITFDSFTLARDEDKAWKLVKAEDAGEHSALSPAEMMDLVEKICDLSPHGWVEESGGEEKNPGSPVLAFSVQRGELPTLQVAAYRLDENTYRVDRSDLDFSVRVSGWQIDDIVDMIDKPEEGESGESEIPDEEAAKGPLKNNFAH